MATDMATGEVRPRTEEQRAALRRAPLATLTPLQLMGRALLGDWGRVDRELRRRGPEACAAALAAMPRDTAAMASAPTRVNGLTLHETATALGLVITDEGRKHVVAELSGHVLHRGDAGTLWCWLFGSGRLKPQKEDVDG